MADRFRRQANPLPVLPAVPFLRTLRGKRLPTLLLGVALFAGKAEAQVCPGVNGPTAQYASEAIAVSSTAIGFTAATINIAKDRGQPLLFAEVTLETNPIRVRADGLAPTAAVGSLWNNSAGGNVKFYVCGETSMRRFLAIRTGSDAAMTAVFYTSQ